ncbi:unnamed protein product [Musa acuminata subsp. burmannicoides]
MLAPFGCLYTLCHGRDIERMEEGNKIVAIQCLKFKCEGGLEFVYCQYDQRCYIAWELCQKNCHPTTLYS